jgi:hypothetical protein
VDHRQTVVETYRYLRVATVVLVVMLLAAVVRQALGAVCVQTSISAYYFTSAHSVFVATLCAIGACLVINKGSSPLEDVVLNFSGYLAFAVAFVPTTREAICGGAGLPASYDVAPGVRNNVLALLIAGVLAEGARLYLTRVERPLSQTPTHLRVVLFVGWAVLGLGSVAFVLAPSTFLALGHGVAAVVMFAGIIYVVMANAWSSALRAGAETFVRIYKTIAWSMAVTLAAVVATHLVLGPWPYAVIVVEVLLIGEFAAFWVVQTVEMWEVADKRELG